MSARIAVVLPRKEAFARDRFGAIALTAEAYARHSRHRAETEILGVAVGAPRDAEVFRAVSPVDAWWRRGNLGFAEGCAAYLAQTSPRYIDVHNRVEVFFRLANRFPDAAVSPWFHNDPQDTRGARTPLQRRRILARARFVICVSDWVRARFLDGVTGDPARVIVLPEGLDTVAAPQSPKKKLILFVGRIIPDKGVLPLAEALSRVLPGLPEWRAAIIGGANPPGTPYERRVAETLKPLNGRVTMPGFLPHERIVAEFSRAAIAAVPSQWEEAFGRTALEAMAAGCAVIASRRGGIPEIVGDAGILLDRPDAASLATAIETLARDEARRAELQDSGRIRAVSEFDIRPWAARLDALRD